MLSNLLRCVQRNAVTNCARFLPFSSIANRYVRNIVSSGLRFTTTVSATDANATTTNKPDGEKETEPPTVVPFGVLPMILGKWEANGYLVCNAVELLHGDGCLCACNESRWYHS